MPKILALSSSLITLKFSVPNLLETRVLFKIFDAKFPYKLSYFEPLCLLAKMAVKTVKMPIAVFSQQVYFISYKVYPYSCASNCNCNSNCNSLLNSHINLFFFINYILSNKFIFHVLGCHYYYSMKKSPGLLD